MLQGAIIGAIAGLIASLVVLYRQTKRSGKLLELIEAGQLDAARTTLDKQAPALDKIPLKKILPQTDRMAGLALLGDARSLDVEVAGHSGHLSAVTQVGAMGLIGLSLAGHDRTDAAQRLGELADQVEREGGRTLTVVKRKLALLAELARGMAGQPLDEQTVVRLDKLAGAQSKLGKIVMWQAIAESFEAAGKATGAQSYRDRVRQLTRAFDRAA